MSRENHEHAWKVIFRTDLGTCVTDWFLTEDAARRWIEKYLQLTVVSGPTFEYHELDF